MTDQKFTSKMAQLNILFKFNLKNGGDGYQSHLKTEN